MKSPHVRELWEMLELVEEILILIPPDQPACLVRASIACKAWCRLPSGHAFRGRYRAFHKTAPILGILQNFENDVDRFVPTTNFCPRNPEPLDSHALDCRHGRVLLAREQKVGEEDYEYGVEPCLHMVVWDPVSGSRTELPEPDGGLGLVHLDHHDLCTVWSMEVNLDGVVSCLQLREMDLKALLPIGDIPTGLRRPKLVDCVEGTDIVVVATHLGVFTIDIKSLISRKLSSKPYLETPIFLPLSLHELQQSTGGGSFRGRSKSK